jgi:hypothetical protein
MGSEAGHGRRYYGGGGPTFLEFPTPGSVATELIRSCGRPVLMSSRPPRVACSRCYVGHTIPRIWRCPPKVPASAVRGLGQKTQADASAGFGGCIPVSQSPDVLARRGWQRCGRRPAERSRARKRETGDFDSTRFDSRDSGRRRLEYGLAFGEVHMMPVVSRRWVVPPAERTSGEDAPL